MLKISFLASTLGLAACVASPAASTADPFQLCRRPPEHADIDYQTLRGSFNDYTTHVMTCGDESPCISFPIAIGVPPRLPERDEEVRWPVVNHRFSIRRVHGSDSDYVIEAIELRPDRTGRARVFHHEYYTYNTSDGVTSYRTEGGSGTWRRCGGRLTFEDLRRLRPRLEPGFRHNPYLQPDSRPALELNELDTNLTVRDSVGRESENFGNSGDASTAVIPE